MVAAMPSDLVSVMRNRNHSRYGAREKTYNLGQIEKKVMLVVVLE